MAKDDGAEVLDVGGRSVRVTHPDKVVFSEGVALTKREIVAYFLSVAEGALAPVRDRPIVLKRFVDGAHRPAFYQKRAPEGRPEWLRTTTLSFPSGRTAEEVVVDDAAGLVFVVNLGCIELHPHAVRAGDLEHPDELRVDLDPGPGVPWDDVRRVALEVRALLDDLGLRGYPKTSGSRGLHVNVRIEPRWTFSEVRRAALALARAVERRAPSLATSRWWKEERHGVLLDYNQNAKDRTTCSAYSVRPLPDARVSTPLDWSEVPDCEPSDFTVLTVPARYRERGDPHRDMDATPGSLDQLLELSLRDERDGLGDAPWPPHYRKAAGEGKRVAPSRARKPEDGGRTVAASAADGADGAAGADGAREVVPAGRAAPAARKKGQRVSKMPLLVIANSPDKDAALAGLERWKARHPSVAALLAADDVLVDSMRGRSSTWTRVRVNLRSVPKDQRPAQETPDPDDDPTRAWRETWAAAKARR